MTNRPLAALLLLGAFVPCPAVAQARNDVITSAFRCAAIGAGRGWLNCYYGAAQPMRARLGLPPAPQDQIALAAAPGPSGRMRTEEAEARDQVIAEALHCSALQDERQWLGCYYAAAQPMRAQLKLSPVAQARTAPPSPPRPRSVPNARSAALPRAPAEEQFGLAAPSQAAGDEQVTSRLADYSFDRYGLFTLRLANGQVWRQIEGDQSRAKLRLAPARYVVTVKNGIFHGYDLAISGVAGRFRVRRAQ